jgi:hypothetical protein
MMYPLLTQLARAEAAIPIAVSCRVLGFSRQAYYSWLADPVSARDLDNAHLTNAALDIQAAFALAHRAAERLPRREAGDRGQRHPALLGLSRATAGRGLLVTPTARRVSAARRVRRC